MLTSVALIQTRSELFWCETWCLIADDTSFLQKQQHFARSFTSWIFFVFFYRLCNLPISGIVNGSFLILLIIGPKIFEGMSSLNGVVLHIYLVSKILHCQLLEYNFNEQIKFTHFEKSWWVHSLNSSYSSGRGVKNLSIVCSMSRYMLWPTTSLPYNFLNITYNL